MKKYFGFAFLFFLFLVSSLPKAYAASIPCDAMFQCRDAMGRDIYTNCQRVVCDRSVGTPLPDGTFAGLCRVSTNPMDRRANCCLTSAECQDGNACTKDACDITTNRCVHTTEMPPSTPAGECKQWLCRPSDGVWQSVPGGEGSPCSDDGNACTLDRCSTGVCTHPASLVPSSLPMPCYQWSCSSSGGWNQTPNDSLACDDGNPCTRTVCRAGTCQDITTPEESALLCPRPVCTMADATRTCNDGNPCTVDACTSSGMCRNTPVTPASIEDGDLCTRDSCSVDYGILHTPWVFNDDNICTVDSCDARTGLPLFTPRPLEDDGNPCTKDVCDPVFGMLHNLDTNRGYECFTGSDCDLTTCRRRLVRRPTCEIDCRQPFMSLNGIRVVPQGEPSVRCAFHLTDNGVSGVTCRGETADFLMPTILPVDTGATGTRTVRALCKTPDDYRFTCEDTLSVVARVGSGGQSGNAGSGNSGGGGAGGARSGTGGSGNTGVAGSGGTGPILSGNGLSNYDVYFCVTHETTALNLRGERIDLTTPCPELPIAQAVEDDQRLIAETLVGLDPSSDHFDQNVRPLIALAVQKWMSAELDRSMYILQTNLSSMRYREILATEKPVVRANFNRYFRITASGIESQNLGSADLHPLFAENSSNPQAILLNFDRVYAEGGGCSLVPLR